MANKETKQAQVENYDSSRSISYGMNSVQNRKFIQLIFIILSFSAFFFSAAPMVEAAADCFRPTCDGASCGGGFQPDGNAIGCSDAGEVWCSTDAGDIFCGVWQEFVYPSYSYQSEAPPSCGVCNAPVPGPCVFPQTSYTTYGTDDCGNPCERGLTCTYSCGGQGLPCCDSQPYCGGGTICCRPGSNQCEFNCYSYESEGPPSYSYESEAPPYSYQSEAPPPPGFYTLTVSVVSGMGTIIGQGINCSGAPTDDCSENYPAGSFTQPFTATGQNPGYTFDSWNGNCTGQTVSCSLLMDGNKTAGATFTSVPPSYGSEPPPSYGSEPPPQPFNVTCTATPNPAVLGFPVTWTAVVDGISGPFAYSWSGPGIPTSPAPSEDRYTLSYGTIGIKTATVRVTNIPDGQEATCGVTESSGTVQVNFNPRFEEF